MFAVQFGININNFYFGAAPGAGSSSPAAHTGHAHGPGAVGQTAALPSQLPTAVFDASAGSLVAGEQQLPAELQRAGLGVGATANQTLSASAGQPDVAHATSNPTSSAASAEGAAPGLQQALGANFPTGGFASDRRACLPAGAGRRFQRRSRARTGVATAWPRRNH